MIGHQLFTCALLWVCVAVCCALYTDPECSTYDHLDYGAVGKCIPTYSCPGKKYISRLCPSQGYNVKCCFTANSDEECASYDDNSYGQVGHCTDTSQCPDDAYISGLCPTKSAGIKCCFKKPKCSEDVKYLACLILENSHITLLDNNRHLNTKGAYDGADAKSNIRDTCAGKKSLRSSYSCSSGSAPGGSVCLSAKVLQYILSLANEGHDIQVNALSGACHSTTSRHYRGTAVDFQIKTSSDYQAWRDKCASMGCVENLGPGNAGHSTHTHCAFAN